MLKKYKDCYYCDKTGKLFDKEKNEVKTHPFLNTANFAKLKKHILEEVGEKELADKVVEEARQTRIKQVVEEIATVAPMKAEAIEKSNEPLTIECQKVDVELEKVELANGKEVYNAKVLSPE